MPRSEITDGGNNWNGNDEPDQPLDRSFFAVFQDIYQSQDIADQQKGPYIRREQGNDKSGIVGKPKAKRQGECQYEGNVG